MVEDINYIKFDDQQLKTIIWCMTKTDDKDGLDEYEANLLLRLEQIQKIRTQVLCRQGEFNEVCKMLKEM